MKLARMLVVWVGLLCLVLTGCVEMDLGIARPFGAKNAIAAERFDDPVPDNTNARATLEKQSSKDDVAVAGTETESVDSRVAELTKRIESLSSRKALDNTTPQAAPKSPSNEVALRRLTPTPAEIDTRPIVDERVSVNAPTGIVQANTAEGALASPQTEVSASPTPRRMPVIQPTVVEPEKTAPAETTANVSVEIIDVRPVVTPVASNSVKTVASPNQPAEGNSNARATDLRGFISQLEQASQQQPPQPEDTLRLRLLYLAAGQDEKAVAPIKDMDPVQAELLTAVVKTVASSRQAMVQTSNSNSTPNALAAADELRRLLSQQSGITIPRMALVTKVTSYGDYETISPPRFKAGNEIHAYVYTEIANFRSEPVDGDRLHTLLGEKVQVFDTSGKTVWERHEKNIEDRVRTPRRDFFIPFPVHLPGNLPPGDYVLKVTVEDHIGGTTDQQRLSFSIQ